MLGGKLEKIVQLVKSKACYPEKGFEQTAFIGIIMLLFIKKIDKLIK